MDEVWHRQCGKEMTGKWRSTLP